MSLREAKKRETAARILAAAQQLFLQRGFATTALEDIAAAAGVSRASLFNYYNGKAAIIDALAARLEPRLVQMLQHYLAKPLSTEQRITALFAHAARVVEQTTELTRLLLVQGSDAADFPALRQVFVKLIEEGQRRGELRDDFSAEIMAEAVYLGFVAGLLGWARSPASSVAEQFSQRARFLCANLLG